MNITLCKFLLILSAFYRGGVCLASDSKSFFDDHGRGWFWYEDTTALLEEELENAKEAPQGAEMEPPKPKTARDRLKEVQEHLAELKAKAILEPTRDNVKAYQEKQMAVMNQSQAFSDAWLLNVFLNPSLDENVKNPPAQSARFVVYEPERQETTEIILKLKDQYGLFYFYTAACPYCKAFAPLLKQFADQYGWEVIAISLDGSPSDVFPNWKPDNGIAAHWQVETMPAVFAINPEMDHVIPVANGFTAIDVMEKRIVALVKGQEKEEQIRGGGRHGG